MSLWQKISFEIARTVVAALLACLSVPGLYRLGRAFGTLEWLVNHKRRRRFAAACERVLGYKPTASQRRRTTREHFAQTRCDKLFYLIIDRIPRQTAVGLLTIENQPLLDEAHSRGRGVYLALSHHGPHHVAATLMALRGYKVAGVRDRKEGGIRRYVQDRFDVRYPDFPRMRVIFADGYPRDIYRCFQDGYVLGSAMDISRVRNPNQKTEEMTIFGERRLFLTGPLRVALRCRTPVLQAFIIPIRAFRYRLAIVEMLVDPDQVEDESAVVTKTLQRYAANVEKYLRATPALMTKP